MKRKKEKGQVGGIAYMIGKIRRFLIAIFAIIAVGMFSPTTAFACASNEFDIGNGTCVENKFSLTTTSLSANDTFLFKLSAIGTFYVDCGAGGTLSGNGVSGNTITRSDTTEETYTCTYSTADVKTIKFGGTATDYNTNTSTAAISFNTTSKTKIAAISGNLVNMFPYISGNEVGGAQPRFYRTFYGATNLTDIANTLFSGYTTGASNMFKDMFKGCTSLESIPTGLFTNITSGATHTFFGTFAGCTSLTTIPPNLFSGVTRGATGLFYSTFEGCSALSTIPSGLFSAVTTTASEVFRQTFKNCTSLTRIPADLFSGITSISGTHVFNGVFSGCTNLGGYIPPTTFAGLIAAGALSNSTMWTNSFTDTQLATSCPTGTAQYITGYEGSGASTWDGKVSCGCPFGQYGDGTTCTACANSKPEHSSWAGGATTSTCAWHCDPGYVTNGTSCSSAAFSVTTTSLSAGDTFSFKLSAVGTFYVNWGDGFEQILTRTNTTETTYTHTYKTSGVKIIGFGGTATNYGTSTSTATISFNTDTQTRIASISGNLATIFPYISGNAASGAQPRFYRTFYGATNLASIPGTLFSGYTAGSTNMFQSTFNGCTSLASIPDGLFSGITSGATYTFNATFYGCTSLATVPDGLFSGITGGANYMFKETFYGCTSLTAIPESLFSGVTTGGTEMFSNTFNGCTNLAGYIPLSTFSGLIMNNHPTGTNMWLDTFTDTQLATSCDGFSGKTQFVTGYEEDWGGKVACQSGSTVTLNKNTSANDSTTVATVPAVYGMPMPGKDTSDNALTIPTNSGYIFAGYYDSRTGGTQYYTSTLASAHNWDKNGPQTLYAQWTQCTGATYPDSVTNTCVSCPAGYTANTTTGKTSINQCQIQCSAGTWNGSYVQLEYLQGNGTTNYIDTGYSVTSTNVVINGVFGTATTASGSSSNIGNMFGNVQANPNNGFSSNYKGGLFGWWNQVNSQKLKSATMSFNADTPYTIVFTQSDASRSMVVNGGTAKTDTKGTATESDNTFKLFSNGGAVTSGGSVSLTAGDKLFEGRIYSLQLSDGGNMVLDLVPVRRVSDGTLGMYNKINGAFYTNAGTGTFTAGPDTATTVPGNNCVNVGDGYYSSATVTNFGSMSVRNQCPDGGLTNKPNATSMAECLMPNGACYPGYVNNGTSCIAAPFSLTTTNLSANGTFQFKMSAVGTFYVNWGDGTEETITRTDTTETTYSHTYTTAGAKTIGFAGTATGYSTTSNIAAIRFNISDSNPDTNAAKVASISGNLATMFPYLGSGSEQQPRFYKTFYGCTNLTSIPAGLFAGYTTGAGYMFYGTFYGCTGLTSIPENLFAGYTTGADWMFWSTFRDCTGLTSIPAGLFSGITTGANNMFAATFQGCTNISGYIPPTTFAGLIANGSPTASNMWYNTFGNTQLVTSCPANTSQYITGYEGSTNGTTWNGKVSCGCPYGTYGDGTTCSACANTKPEHSSWAGGATTSTCAWRCDAGYVTNGTACVESTFSLTTTNLSANDTFQFKMSATGTFGVNCGDGGTLSGTGVSGNTITRTGTNLDTYTCTYSTAGAKTIGFGGTATGYRTDPSIAAIRFNISGGNPDTNATKVASISGNLATMFPYISGNSANGAQPRLYYTFKACTNLTSIPENLVAGYTTGAYGMFFGTFWGCTGLTSIPAGLFSGITTGANYMFYKTFDGCTNISGYIPPTTFAGLIANGSSTATSMWQDTFYDTQLATSCPFGTVQYITGYEGTDTSSYTKWNGKVSCEPAPIYTITLDSTGATTNVSPNTVYLKYNTGWYSNSTATTAISQLSTVPAKNGKLFMGFYTGQNGTGTRVIDANGNFLTATSVLTFTEQNATVYALFADPYTVTYSCGTGTGTAPANAIAGYGAEFVPATVGGCAKSGYMFAGWKIEGTNTTVTGAFTYNYNSNKTLTAQWVEPKFSVTTTNMPANTEFRFGMSAMGTFTVDWGDGTVETIDRDDTDYTTYGHTYASAGVKTIQFDGRATGYSTDTDYGTAITFSPGDDSFFDGTPELIASISGSLGAIFPTLGNSASQQPMFMSTFYGAENLTNIPGTLFSGVSGAAEWMFYETFMYSGLTSIPENLFTGVSGAADDMFRDTFRGCTSLTSIPGNLFAGVNGAADDMFMRTFYNCSSLTSIPGNLFAGVTGAAYAMFDGTFYGCTNLSGYIPPTTFVGLIANNHPTASGMWNDTFYNTQLATSCPANTTQYITGYEGSNNNGNNWNGKVSCAPANVLTVTLNDASATTSGSPATAYLKFNDGWYSDSAGTTAISQLATVPAKTGYAFNGFWSGQNGTGIQVIDASGNFLTNGLALIFTDTNATVYADFLETTFSITTTELDDNTTFSFYMSAAGSFSVNWGDGTIDSINRTDNTTKTKYSHTYTDGGTYTISFSGTATGYSTSETVGAIEFYNATPKLIYTVEGSLGNMFPTLGQSNGQQPRFFNTFRGCTHLRYIPSILFNGVTGNISYMFADTFYGCADLHNIPAGLFSGITGGAEGLFYETFYNDKEISTSIPADLFAGITVPSRYMFYRTFYNTYDLDGYIPVELFAGLNGQYVSNMMNGTFDGSGLTTDCAEYDENLIQITTGYEQYWDDHVACGEPGFRVAITLDNTGATTNASPTTVYLGYDDDWYTSATGDTTIDHLATVPAKTGYVFAGYYSGRNGTGTQIIDGGGNFQYGDALLFTATNATIYPNWVQFSPKFSVTTTNLSANTEFRFGMSASGNFIVDWGDGTVETITRNNTNYATYSHTYTTAGVKTIGFDGRATGYSTDNLEGDVDLDGMAIEFGNYDDADGTPTLIASIFGSLGAIFPELGNSASQKPMFLETFYGCSNLTSIPETLFSGLTGGRAGMFNNTFRNCTSLTSIPGNLFSGVTNAAEYMFSDTFSNCSSLTSIPENLFAGVTGAAKSMFESTFRNCTSLTSIPENLFAGVTGAAEYMFGGTFRNCTSLTSIPGNLFAGVTGAAEHMFGYTFDGCSSLTSIPGNLFAGVTGAADYMFDSTFYNCTSLTSIPGNLFSGVSGAAEWMFWATFSNCTSLTSIPGNLFAGVTGAAQSMFDNTFYGCTSLTSIPGNLFSGVSGAAQSMFSYTFYGCTNLSGYIPPSTFAGLIANNHPTTNYMWVGAFGNTQLATACPSGTTQYTTGYESIWEASKNHPIYGGGRAVVSCEPTTATVAITLNDASATTAVSPATVYLKFGDGWYSDSAGTTSIATLATMPTKTGKMFNGFWSGQNGTGTQIIDRTGAFVTTPTALGFSTTATTIYADWRDAYTVTYACGDGATGTAPTSATAMTGEQFTPADVGGCAKSGYMFNGWAISGTNTVVNGAFNYNYSENKTLTAQWTPGKFSVTTTNLSAGTQFRFGMSASGNFTVDCGAGGTLSGTGVSGRNITRNNTDYATYTCSYSTGGVKTIKFDGLASGYYPNDFDNWDIAYTFNFGLDDRGMFDNLNDNYELSDTLTPGLIAGISGSLGAIFPTLGNGANQQPIFAGTFAGTNITSIPENLFAGVTGVVDWMFSSTFYNCSSLTSIPENLFAGVTGAADNMFLSTFEGTSITSIPGNLFSGVTGAAYGMFNSTFAGTSITNIPGNLFSGVTGAANYMFSYTFAGTGITSIPGNLFAGVTGAANYMFSDTFEGCSSLTSIPENLFAGVTGAAGSMFGYTFNGCTNLSGYIPPSTFAGLIANNHPTATQMWQDTFASTQLATSCPSGTTQYTTGYESSWKGKVSCTPNNTVAVTLNDASATTAVSPATVYLNYGDGWYSDSAGTTSIAQLATVPTKTGKMFNGFWSGQNGTGTQIIDRTGAFLNTPTAVGFSTTATTIYADWRDAKFSITTTNLTANTEFKFGISASGVFYVDCGDGGTLSGTGVSGNTITRNDTTEALYTCTYTTAGVKTIRFDGLATGYNTTQENNYRSVAAIRFGEKVVNGTSDGATGSLVASISGSLGAIFPTLGTSYSQQPVFEYTFRGSQITSIPENLFAGVTGGTNAMFHYTFYDCQNLTSIPANLFSGITGGYYKLFSDTFEGCSSLTSIPEDLFKDVTLSAGDLFFATFKGCSSLTSIPAGLFRNIHYNGSKHYMFYETFRNCTSLQSIPENLFAGVTGAAYAMFDGTFRGCTSLTSLPGNLFAGVSGAEGYMFGGTFYGCTNLSGYIPPSTFAGLIANNHPTANNMWNSAFVNTQLATSCPSGTTQYTTGYEDYWSGHVSCTPSTTVAVTLNDGSATTAVAPGTVYLQVGDGWYSDSAGTTSISRLGTVPAKTGKIFNGFWTGQNGTGTQIIDASGNLLTGTSVLMFASSNTTVYAHWLNAKFSVTTTNLSAGTQFKFGMSASGNFVVDCGAGGTLSGTGVYGNTITRTNTDYATYTCTYTTGGVKLIAFDGLASGYHTNDVYTFNFGVDRSGTFDDFNDNYELGDAFTPELIAGISGSLGAIFPTLGNGANQQPIFAGTFAGTNITSIPENLFAGVTGAPRGMFAGTFYGCTSLTSIPENLFAGVSGAARGMFLSTFDGCSSLTSIPENLFAGVTGAATEMFSITFAGCTSLTSIPENLFAGVNGAADYMFLGTFSGCTSLTSIPENLFAGVNGAAAYMFQSTFRGCSSLTSIPGNLFAGVSGAENGMFFGTFDGCTNLSGYIPPSTFAGLIANNHPTTNYMWMNAFLSTQLATSCPSGTSQYTTGYEGSGASTWNGKVSCTPSTTVAVTLNDGSATTAVAPGTVYLQVGTGWYSDSAGTTSISHLGTVPAKTGKIFNGFWTGQNGTGTQIIDASGNLLTGTNVLLFTNTAKTIYADWQDAKFSVTTTNMSANTEFRFGMSASGKFVVDWGDGTVETITRDNTNYATYSHTYTTAGVKTIKFGGLATGYNTGTNTDYSTAITFGPGEDGFFSGTTPTLIASISGSLGAIFPTLGNSASQQPMFQSTFYGAENLTSIPGNLFSGVSGAGYKMFHETFMFSGLTSIPENLFAGVTGAATNMFGSTFHGCSSLQSIPGNLFSGVSGAAYNMFSYTFTGCSSLTSIPENLFAGVNGAATSMFGSTFKSCTSLTSIPGNLFSGVSGAAYGMFYETFRGCTNLSGYIPPTTFAGLIANNHPTATDMWSTTFAYTQLATSCPSGTTQYTTGYESYWDGKVSCQPTNLVQISLNDGNASTHVSPSTVYLMFGDGFYIDSNGDDGISTLTTVPSKSGKIFDGFYTGQHGTGTKIIDENGDFFVNPSSLMFTATNTTLYANYTSGEGLCPDGQYKDENNNNTCTTCPAGSFCADGAVAPTPCAVGSYSAAGASECTVCSWGLTTDGVGQTSCDVDCPNATASYGWEDPEWNPDTNTVSNLCVLNACDEGYYPVIDNNGNTCSACPAVYPNTPGKSVSVYAVVNNYDGDGRKACYLRREEINGSYIATPGDLTATPCPAGFYSYYTEGNNSPVIHFGESYTCDSCQANTYSTGGATACTACLTNYVTFGEKTSSDACRISCSGGYYLRNANDTECTAVGVGHYAPASNTIQGQTSSYQSCPTGLTNIGYGVGADEAGDCGRILHIGDYSMYLRSDRKTDHTLNVKIGNDVYYGNMATGTINMSYGVNKSLKVNWNNVTYSVYDDSGETYVAEPEVSIQLDPNVAASSIVPAKFGTANTSDNPWSAVVASNGENITLTGHGKCDTAQVTTGVMGAADFEPAGSGAQCWCKLDTPAESTRWVAANKSDATKCPANCGFYCANNMKSTSANPKTFRRNLYSSAGILQQ